MQFESEDRHQDFAWDPGWPAIVAPGEVLSRLRPGMCLFVGTGPAEPRTLVRELMGQSGGHLQDLELLQLVSLGEAINLDALASQRYRLKTFFSGWVAGEAIREGRVDLIPSRFSKIPGMIRSGLLNIDAAFVQVSAPDANGLCSLGLAVDVAREAMGQASLVVGEINRSLPVTYGDTFVHVSEFDFFVRGEDGYFVISPWTISPVFEKIAAHVASIIEDGTCLGFSLGPLYEALAQQLKSKKELGVHSPFFTDALMELIQSGAVTNRQKKVFVGKSIASYAMGSERLLRWLHKNPLAEFQPMEKVFDPRYIGRNPKFAALISARKVDLRGQVALHAGKGNITAGPGEAADFVNGAEMSRGGFSVFALPSRNLQGQSNILLSIDGLPNVFGLKEAVDLVVTEYGVAALKGRSIRERALSLIDIAHPEDRMQLITLAKENRIIYEDQIYLESAGVSYPAGLTSEQTFKGQLTVRFRPIKPSDEEQMRRLFYRFSDRAVYYRYFSPIKAMPHKRMQEYVNVDFNRVVSIVGEIGPIDRGRLIAEARYVKSMTEPWADIAFLVDEEYQGSGIATYLLRSLMKVARARCLQGFTADVLVENRAMFRVLEKAADKLEARVEHGAYQVRMPFTDSAVCSWNDE